MTKKKNIKIMVKKMKTNILFKLLQNKTNKFKMKNNAFKANKPKIIQIFLR